MKYRRLLLLTKNVYKVPSDNHCEGGNNWVVRRTGWICHTAGKLLKLRKKEFRYVVEVEYKVPSANDFEGRK